MALFKILRGQRINLKDHAITDGYAYVTLDEHNMYIDSGTDTRFKLGDKESTPFIVGTQTTVTNQWTGKASSVDALFDGLTIRYQLPYGNSGIATLNLTLSDGTTTGEIPCYFSNVFRLNNEYPAGTILTLTYRKAVSISGTVYTGWWINHDGFFAMDESGTIVTSIGGAHRPIYLSNGILKQLSFTLDATLKEGNVNTLAYYSKTDEVSSNPNIFIHSDKIAIGNDVSDYNLYVNGNSYITSNLSVGKYNKDYLFYVDGESFFNDLISLAPNKNDDEYIGALNLNSSNIYGIHSLIFSDLADNAKEGLQWYRTATTVDTIWVKNGIIYFTPNRTLGTEGTSYLIPFGSSSGVGTNGLSILQLNPNGALVASNRNEGDISTPLYLKAGVLTTVKHPTAGDWFTGIPVVYSDGVTALGRYLDFHPEGTSDLDYHVRIDSGENVAQRVFTFGSIGGEFVTHAANTQIGNTNVPIYINSAGIALPLTATIGSDGKTIVYFDNGAITASTATEGGSAHPVYLKDGVLTGISGNIGDVNTPVYINNGTITTTGKSLTTIPPNQDSDDNTFPSSKAIWTAMKNGVVAVNDAMVFKGTIGVGGTIMELPAIHQIGWTYRVITVGYYAGQVCEIGDLIICLTNGTTADDSHWTVAQSNIDGAIVTPSDNRTIGGTARPIYINNGVATQIDYVIGASIPQGMATQMLYYDTVNSLKTISTANGVLYATADNGTPIWGTLPVAQGGTGAVEPFAARENLGFNTLLANTATDTGWSMIESTFSTTDSHDDFILKSIRTQEQAPAWIYNNYAAGIAFGGGDSKGVISVPYNAPGIRIAGGNGHSPNWHFTISATAGCNYIMGSAAGYIPTSPNRQAGGSEQPVYIDSNGIIQNTAYALKASINDGITGKLAYYANNRSISYLDHLSYATTLSTASTPATLNTLQIWGETYGDDEAQMLSGSPGVFSYGDGGPQIQFSSTPTGDHSGALIFTDHASAGDGVSWHFVSTESDWNVHSKRFVATTSVTIGRDVPITDYSLFVSGDTTINGTLRVYPTSGNYCEGIRIYPTNGTTTCILMGNDAPGTTGTTPNSWLFTNRNGELQIYRGTGSTAYLRNLSNGTWNISGILSEGRIIQQCDRAAIAIQDTSTSEDTYSLLCFGNKDVIDAASIYLNGPSRTVDGGPNILNIRNTVGDLRLQNNVIITGDAHINNNLICEGRMTIQGYQASLVVQDTSVDDANGFSAICLGNQNRLNAALMWLNGPSGTIDGEPNVLNIRNNVGDLKLHNNTTITGTVNINRSITCNGPIFVQTNYAGVGIQDTSNGEGYSILALGTKDNLNAAWVWLNGPSCTEMNVTPNTMAIRNNIGNLLLDNKVQINGITHLKSNLAGLAIQDTSDGEKYSILALGNKDTIDGAWVWLNGPSGTFHGEPNMMGIKNNVGDLLLDNDVYISGLAHIKSNTLAGLAIQDMSDGDRYSIITLGNKDNIDGAWIWLNGPSGTFHGGSNMMGIKNNVGDLLLENNVYVYKNIHVNRNHALTFPFRATATANEVSVTTPTALSYGRLQSQDELCINADTDNTGTQQVIITAGHGMSSDTADGLSIGADSLKWKDVDVVRNTGTWNINVTGSAGSFAHKDFTRSLQLTTEWMDTGIIGANLETGTYIIQVFCTKTTDGGHLWYERYSGIMTWYKDVTNNAEADEIPLHNAGHSPEGQRIFLRTLRTINDGSGTGLKLQIATTAPWTTPSDIVFKFALIISG